MQDNDGLAEGEAEAYATREAAAEARQREVKREEKARHFAKRREAGLPRLDAPAKRAERQRAIAKRKAAGLSRKRPRREMAFVGVDGEGGGTDALGRQHYQLLRAGAAELLVPSGQMRLSTAQCLEFLCSLPRNCIYVGFAFGYDVTQILRDLDADRVAKLFLSDHDKDRLGLPRFRYVLYGEYGVEYLPRQYFRVCRLGANNRPIPGSSRTVYEVFGFFQCSFLKALDQFGIGTQELRERIELGKAGRDQFGRMTQEIRRYCADECALLADLMEKFRAVCTAGQMVPRTWNGAGKLAAALHRDHKTLRRLDAIDRDTGEVIRPGLASLVPAECMAMARDAYYGGRFEISATGRVRGPIYEYDIRSAYPAAMQDLPCLEHGIWTPCEAPTAGLYVAEAIYVHPKGTAFCGLPYRSKSHRLSWPRRGAGVYWSVEIEAARALGATVTTGSGWQYECRCECRPFGWVRALYDYRRQIGAAREGIPIKLGINSLYGQLARRIGDGGPWQNHLWAGLITASTRAKLSLAVASAPSDILMLATDAVYSRSPLGVEIGEGLGQWEAAEHPEIFIVQPGLYWGPPKPKTRGIPRKFFTERTGDFERAWADWLARHRGIPRRESLPRVSVSLRNFIGVKLAHARGKIETAGAWVDEAREIRFDWSDKREMHSAKREGEAMHTSPHAGAAGMVSHVYDWNPDTISMAQELTGLTEGLPDFLDFSAPGFD